MIAHEYGHYLQDAFSRDDSPGGKHGGFNDRLDMRVAFSEGWGNGWAAIALGNKVYADTAVAGAFQGFSMDVSQGETTNPGWFKEASIQRVFWDMNANPAIGFNRVWDTLRTGLNSTPALTSIHSFAHALAVNNPSAAALVHAEQLRATSAGPIWVSAGRLVYYKALDVALRALREVPGTLHIIGTGPMESAWRSLAASLGVADRVVWRGRVSDDELVGTYRAATALWFPSNERSEGFGLVQVEAMACGCPVVNANIPHSGVPWVSRHNETGLTVPVNDPVAFAAAARCMLMEAGLRERLSHEAILQAKLRFDAVQMAARSLEIYREAITR